MRAQEKILGALSMSPLCDDCLSVMCAIHPRQQVNQRCNYLLEVGHLTREEGLCPKCGRQKLVNRVKPEAVDKIRRRGPIRVQMDLGKLKSAIERGVEEGSAITCGSLPPPRPWYWEGQIQDRVVEHLVREGFRVTATANTKRRESGKDIEARSSDGKKLWVTVKGYPEKSPHTQARHWFGECLFDLILYQEQDATALLGIGLPDGYATYHNLAKRITWFKNILGFRFYWVSRDGSVREE